jgi:Cys-tRNA(Pro)/Cys-tRNA(Cys) deacylase
MIKSPVTELLTSHSIPFDVIEIPLTEDKKPIRNLEELLQAEGCDPHSVVRSILFKTPSGEFVLLAIAGGGKVDWAVLRKHLGERKLRMAEFDEVEQATSYVVGAVPPIALPDTVRVIVDDSIQQFKQVIIGSGVLGYALSLSRADFQALLPETDQGSFTKE